MSRQGSRRQRTWPQLATELLHLPDKPAGVETAEDLARLATELLHLPDKPAGVRLSHP